MSDVSDLTQRLQARILSEFASTVSVNGDLTIITTPLNNFEVTTQVREYDQGVLDDSQRVAGALGSLAFVSQLGVFYKESLEAYRLLVDTYCDTTSNQVWAKRDGCPEGYIRIGMSAGAQITQSQNGMSDEALMSGFYAFANDTHALSAFADSNLEAYVDEA